MKKYVQGFLEQEQKLKEIQRFANLGNWELDIKKNELLWSDEIYRIFDCRPQDFKATYEAFLEFIHPDDREKVNLAYSNSLKTKKEYQIEHRIITKKKKLKFVREKCSTTFNEKGEPLSSFGIVIDITEQKQIEIELAESLERFKALHNASTGGIAIHDRGIILECNQGLSDMMGYTQDELKGMDGLLLIAPEHRDRVMSKITAGYEKPYEADGMRKNGEQFPMYLEARNIPYKGKNVRTVEFRDLTEQKRSERLLKQKTDEIEAHNKKLRKAKERAEESEERYNLAMKAANDGIFDWNLENNEIYYSPGWKKMLGYEEDEIPNDFSVWENRTKQEDVKKAWELQKRVIEKRSDRFVMEFKMRHKDGHWIDILSRAEAAFDNKGKAVRMIGTHTDITERKRSEEQMLLLSTITENMSEAIVVTDTAGQITYINGKAQKLFGYTLNELYGKNPGIFNVDPQADKIQKELLEAVAEGKIFNGEALNRRKDGSEFICDFTIAPMTDKNGKVYSYVGLHRDITEKKNLEEGVIRHERLSAIGELASGVAHDFNNVLQIIMGGVEMALVSEEPEQVKQYLKSIKHSASDAASRVRQLQRFAQKSPSQKENVTININNLAEDVIKEVKLLLNQYQERGIHIALESDYRANSNIEGNEGELRTCLVNLVKNSAEAMPEGGRITISTGDDNGQVRVRIADTGTGMDRETQKKIFQPFFSTKGFEPGRGLGMAQVYSTIRDHNGDIYIKESEIDKGTIIEFTLPSSKKQINFEEKKEDISGSAKILWVDDEEMIRNIGLHMLKTLGHRADMASSGAEALEYLAKGNEYDLVITDVGMPEMSGWQLAEQIKKEGYPTKIAVLTGWGTEISQEDKKRYNVSYVLGKPVPLKDLKALIGEVLGGKAH